MTEKTKKLVSRRMEKKKASSLLLLCLSYDDAGLQKASFIFERNGLMD